MKLISIRKKIITNALVSALLIIALGAVIVYDSHRKKATREEAEKVEEETLKIKDRSAELQNKILEARKYQEIWKTISSNRKVISNLKIDDINSMISKIADKYSITKPAIKMTIPEEMRGGIFQRSTVSVASSTATLTFNSLNDIKALAFISELVDSAPGYIIISSFEMKKGKKYSDQDLIQISSGNGAGAVNVKVDFFWYLYKDKSFDRFNPISLSEQNNPQETQ